MNRVSTAQFEEHANAVYGWAFRLLGRHHDALDVVQDVFLRWSRQCRERPPVQPRGWLRRVTLNKAIDAIRAARVRPSDSLETEPAARDDISTVEPSDQSVLRRDVAAALAGLTEVQRGVLVAKVFDDMTFAEIAGELGLAVSTVKTHYVRAVGALRDRLEGRWSEMGQ